MLTYANGTAVHLAQRLIADEPTPALVHAASEAARQQVATRLRTDLEFWQNVMRELTVRPGDKHAASLLYPRAMQALRTIATGAEIGAYQTTEEKALGLYLIAVGHMAGSTAAESAANYLQDGNSHRDAVRKAVEWVGSAS